MINSTASIGLTMKDTIPATVGAVGATFPLWNVLSGLNELIISVAGIVALALTIWIKLKELKIKKAELKQLQEG